jgi:hypothetical protein
MSGPTGNRIADFLQQAAGPRGIKPAPDVERAEPFPFIASAFFAFAILVGLYVWSQNDQDRQHEVKVCLLQTGWEGVHDPHLSQHCKDVLADEAVRREEAEDAKRGTRQ